MPSPFVHSLLPPSCALFTQPLATRSQKIKFTVIAVLLANMPDFDFIPATFICSNWTQAHRHVGHNLVSLTLCVLVGVWAFRKFLAFAPRRAWTLAIALVGSHAVLDGMQAYQPNGIRPGVPLLWPLSSHDFALPFPLFRFIPTSRAENPIITHLTSFDFWGHVLLYELVDIAALLAIWMVAWKLGGLIVARVRSSTAGSLPQIRSENPEAEPYRASA